MRIALAIMLTVAGCAAKLAPAASPAGVATPGPTVLREPAADMSAIYNDTWSAQRQIVEDPSSPARMIRGLQRIDTQAIAALQPWRTDHPHPTREQIERAIVALSALKAYLALEAPAHSPAKGK